MSEATWSRPGAERSAETPAADAVALARGAFLATMSHELRTPMVGVLGFAQLLADTPLDPWQREFVRAIQECGDELLATIDHVLLASALESGAVSLVSQPLTLRPLLEEVVGAYTAKAADKHLELTLSVAPDAPARISVDASRLTEVLGQLIGNAIKFTDAGRVVVKAWWDAEQDPPRLYLSVRDTGGGVPAALRPRLFRHFVQGDGSTTRRHAGMGLGLAICRRLVELMGGAIGVDGAAGEGATFWCAVPVVALVPSGEPADLPTRPAVPAPSPRVPEPAAAASVADAPGREVRVLVVDDQPVNQKIARHVLERLGCRVDLAADGAQAVERALDGRYDLILMDCHMPRMDGFEAAREIRRREPLRGDGRTPIVALTASSPEADRGNCDVAGMDDFLTKPIELEALGRVLRRFTLIGPRRPAATPASG
jgi:CheY-like chemotaxis protein